MIKRRFYRQDHGDKDNVSDSSSSSSSSDSDVEAQSSDASEEAGEEAEVEQQQQDELSDRANLQVPSSSSSSGYKSEDSSADELDTVSSGKIEKIGILETLAKDATLPDNAGQWILKSKSVFKCRLCPKVVCLNEETLKTHLKSKRHARSEKLLSNGRLKHMLNSDGEEEVVEEEGETHAERHARIVGLAKEEPKKKPQGCQETKKKPQGRQRQRLRMKRKKEQNESATKETSQNVATKKTNQDVATKKTSQDVAPKKTTQNVKRQRKNV